MLMKKSHLALAITAATFSTAASANLLTNARF